MALRQRLPKDGRGKKKKIATGGEGKEESVATFIIRRQRLIEFCGQREKPLVGLNDQSDLQQRVRSYHAESGIPIPSTGTSTLREAAPHNICGPGRDGWSVGWGTEKKGFDR